MATDILLARLTAEAIEANPGAAMLAARAQAAARRVRPAGALPDPSLSLMVMDLTLPHFRFRESDFTEVDVEARQEFPWPGTQGARTRAATAAYQEHRADLAAYHRGLAVEVAGLYHRLRSVVTAREILRSQLALLEASVEVATARYASGSVSQSDPLSARTSRARVGSEAAALAAEEAGLRARLAALRGKSTTESLSILPLAPDSVLARSLGVEVTGTDSLERHPILQGRRAAIASAEASARAEELGARPDVMVMVRYGMRPIASDFFTAGLGVRVPLWAGRKQKQLAAAMREEARAEQAALAEGRVRLFAEFAEAAALARAGRERLQLLVGEVIPSAEAERDAALRNYRVGQVVFQAVLTGQENLYRSQIAAAAVAAEYLTQLVRLEQLTRGEELP
ncbi:MAG: TolC family protein [Gemmatimonadales bacterium]